MNYNILVVEDQKEISDIVYKYLTKEGYVCHVAGNGFEALDYLSNNECHLLLLDVMMPGISGFEVLNQVRKVSDVPIVMLTAKQEETDRLRGFDGGADDYVTKPFSARELVKRIKAILRRTYQGADEIIYSHNELKLFSNSMKLTKRDNEIEITSVEFNLLLTLFKNKGQILSRERLISLSFGDQYEGYDRNIDSYIKRIRKKIEDDPKNPVYLVTKYGAGYVFGGDEG